MYKDYSKLKGVTVTFTMILNTQIAQAMDAINSGDLEKAYETLKTLIDALRPEHRDPLLDNVNHLEELLKEAKTPKSAGFYSGLLETTGKQQAVLRQNIRDLFQNVMETLHRGGYLEKRTDIPVGRE